MGTIYWPHPANVTPQRAVIGADGKRYIQTHHHRFDPNQHRQRRRFHQRKLRRTGYQSDINDHR